MKLAFMSPLPPARSGVADCSATLLPALGKHAEVTAFVQDGAGPPLGLAPPVEWLPAQSFRPEAFDLVLYQMGNSEYHTFLYDQLQRHPGITTLHEVYLHHFVAHTTAGRGDYPAYVRELGYAYGPGGAALARAIWARGAPHPLHALPLCERVVDSSLGIIVHSQYARQFILERRPLTSVAFIPQPIPLDLVRPARRKTLDIPADALLLAVAGHVTPEKQVPAVLKALSELRQQGLDAYLLVIGQVPRWYDKIEAAVHRLMLANVVRITGYVRDPADFVGLIASADICVNLRAPSLGETSGSLLHMLAQAKPSVVCDTGWYGELPRHVCCHVPLLGKDKVDQKALVAALRGLAEDSEERRQLGSRARSYALSNHHTEAAAQAYFDYVQTVVGSG